MNPQKGLWLIEYNPNDARLMLEKMALKVPPNFCLYFTVLGLHPTNGYSMGNGFFYTPQGASNLTLSVHGLVWAWFGVYSSSRVRVCLLVLRPLDARPLGHGSLCIPGPRSYFQTDISPHRP